MDTLVLRLRSDLGRARLDRATMLDALVRLASDTPSVYGLLLSRMEDV